MNKRTKRIYISGAIGLVLIIVVVLLYLFQFQHRTFTDKKNGFSIEYPADWEVLKDHAGAPVQLRSPLDGALDVFYENVTVIVQDISQEPMTLSDYSDKAIWQMEVVFMQNFVLEESTALATLSGHPAYKVIFTGLGPDTEIMYYMTWTVLNKTKVYQVVYTALPSQFEKYYPVVERMLSSFKIF